MSVLTSLLHLLLHLDVALPQLLAAYGAWAYALLFVIIFCETGLVVTPFLPGDSLIFMAGAMAAQGTALHAPQLALILVIAAVAGNTSNYWIGRYLGPRVFHWENTRWFNRHALDEAHAFYLKHGALAITAARFIPIVRTFAPFVAGIAVMPYGRFQLVNIGGACAWVVGFVLLGYFFGNLEMVRHNLMLVMVAVILISVMPVAIGAWRARRERRV